MKKYNNYKDSGIEWIGEIPEHWNLKRLKYLVSLNDETLSEKTDEETLIEYIEIGDLKNGGISSTEYCFVNAPSRARRIVRSGDVIVSTVRTYLKAIAQIGGDKDGFIASTGFAVLRPKAINSRFLGYYSHSRFFIDSTIANSVGVTYPAINASNILDFPIQIPTPEEQTAIANYLDRKTTEIDELITDKKRLLELYEEEKTAIINQAVTKGINPDAPMKDSGIEWLGEIPEHWEVRKANSLISVKRGAGYQYITEVYGDEEFEYVLRISDFNNYDPIRALKTEELGKYRVATGEILIAGTGASAGITMYVDEKMDGLVHSYNALRISVSKPFVLFNKYLFFLFQSHMLNEQMSLAFTGSAQHFLDVGRITSFLITLPDFQEQQTIVHHIETECARIDAKKAKTEKLIELLTEYRTALISEVVTGKIKVTE